MGGISDWLILANLISTDKIYQISTCVWGDGDKDWHIKSLIYIFYHLRIPDSQVDFIAKCMGKCCSSLSPHKKQAVL